MNYSKRQIITLKYQKLRQIILLLLIIVNLQVKIREIIIKEKGLVDKSNISNLLSTKIAKLATKA